MNNSQKVAELIETLAKNKGISISTVLSELEMNKNALFTMKNSGYLPRIENLAKFADYFEVSVDYLLGRTDTPNGSADTYIGENNSGIVQAHNGSAVVNAAAPDNRSNEIMVQFLNAFDKLEIEDKVEVMSLAMQKAKKGA